jgi:hypothetical protein
MLVSWGCSSKTLTTTNYDHEQQRGIDLKETKERNTKRPAFTTEELQRRLADPTHAAHLKLWRESRSYYALLGLLEGLIEPEIGRMRRKDIRELLGDGSPNYPGSKGRLLDYGSDRQLPVGSHLLIGFDENDLVDSIEWVSE